MAKKRRKGKGKGLTAKTNKTNQLVDSIINPEIRSLDSQKAQINRDYTHSANMTKNMYERGKGDISHIYGETDAYLNSLSAKNTAEATASASRSEAAAAALKARLGDTYSGVQTGAADELARLGISGGGNFGGLMADAANASYTADQSSANARSTLDQSNSNAALVMSLLQGMNAGSKMSATGKNLNARNDAMSLLQQQRIQNLNKVGDALTETRKGRGDLFTQLFSQLQQSGWKGILKG